MAHKKITKNCSQNDVISHMTVGPSWDAIATWDGATVTWNATLFCEQFIVTLLKGCIRAKLLNNGSRLGLIIAQLGSAWFI